MDKAMNKALMFLSPNSNERGFQLVRLYLCTFIKASAQCVQRSREYKGHFQKESKDNAKIEDEFYMDLLVV